MVAIQGMSKGQGDCPLLEKLRIWGPQCHHLSLRASAKSSSYSQHPPWPHLEFQVLEPLRPAFRSTTTRWQHRARGQLGHGRPGAVKGPCRFSVWEEGDPTSAPLALICWLELQLMLWDRPLPSHVQRPESSPSSWGHHIPAMSSVRILLRAPSLHLCSLTDPLLLWGLRMLCLALKGCLHQSLLSHVLLYASTWPAIQLQSSLPLLTSFFVWKLKKLVTQLCSCLTPKSMDCSLPGSSVYGMLQGRVLEWIVSVLIFVVPLFYHLLGDWAVGLLLGNPPDWHRMMVYSSLCSISPSFLGNCSLGFRFELTCLLNGLSAIFRCFLSPSKGGQEWVFLLKEKQVPSLCLVCTLVYSLSCFSRVWLFATLRTVAHQAPLSMGFSRQEYWSGLPGPSPSLCP